MGGRIIRENDCLILHIFPMEDGEIREEVPMDVMIHKPAEREAQLMQANREELVERIARAMRADGTTQPFPGLHLYRRSSPLQLLHGVSEPSVSVIAQGSRKSFWARTATGTARHSICWPPSSCPPSAEFSKPRRSGPTSVFAWNSLPPSLARSCLRPVTPLTPRFQAALM